jgi:hypothetical protein
VARGPPLVGEFEFNGHDVFVIANHFDAKLGDQSQDGRFQFPAQSPLYSGPSRR